MSEIYVINPEENLPEVEPDVLPDVNREITEAETEEIAGTDVLTANASGLTSHLLLTAQQGLTCTGGFIACSSSGLKFSDNSIQTTASFASDYFNWVSKSSSFNAEYNRRYVIFGNNTPTNMVITLPTGYNDLSIHLAVDYSTGSSFKISPNISDTIETYSNLIVDASTGGSGYYIVTNRKIMVLIYKNNNWKVYNI